MFHWAKQIMPYVSNFKKEVAHTPILLYGFLMREIFQMKQPRPPERSKVFRVPKTNLLKIQEE